MASRFRVFFWARFFAPAILGVLMLTVGLAPSVQARPTIGSVTSRLAALAKSNEALTEQYNRAGVELQTTQRDANAAALAARRAQYSYETARAQVKLSIADQFRGDGLDRASALLTSNSGQNYLDRMSALQLVSARRTLIATELQAQKDAAEAARVRADELAAETAANRAALAAQRVAVKAQQSRYRTMLDKLNAAQRRALLAATAPAGTARAATAGAATAGAATAGSTVGTVNRPSSPFGTVPAPSRAAGVAVRFALAQLGKPYVFAAAGPGSYDCSGLTMAAWRAAGVSLPHFARWQYNQGHHVSRDQLAPGDLVFFYSPISHVAMYIGNGLIVHAPTSGDVVRVVPLSNFSSDYVGATRL